MLNMKFNLLLFLTFLAIISYSLAKDSIPDRGDVPDYDTGARLHCLYLEECKSGCGSSPLFGCYNKQCIVTKSNHSHETEFEDFLSVVDSDQKLTHTIQSRIEPSTKNFCIKRTFPTESDESCFRPFENVYWKYDANELLYLHLVRTKATCDDDDIVIETDAERAPYCMY